MQSVSISISNGTLAMASSPTKKKICFPKMVGENVREELKKNNLNLN
jgi:hypothetical protein